MSNDTINAEVAEATGEDIETIRDLGFYLIIQVEPDETMDSRTER